MKNFKHFWEDKNLKEKISKLTISFIRMAIHKIICKCIQQHFNNIFHNANLTLTINNVGRGMSGQDQILSQMFRP